MKQSIHPPLTNWTDALGSSEAFLAFQEHLAQAADSERPVLILGERGSGKELAARRLHFMSRRWEKPFIALLCSALNPNLLEAELFGVEPGAYTGARERRAGFFERADQGTLFLDEVADMPLALQDKLLRVLEYGVFERVGGGRSIQVDIRVVAATNKDMRALARSGAFREDLLDRLACEVVHVPPLRARGSDVETLAAYFANRLAVELGFDWLRDVPEGVSFSSQALAELRAFRWPGNVRELRNTVERSLLRERQPIINRLVLDAFQSPWDEQTPCVATPAKEARSTFREDSSPLSLPADYSLPEAVHALERQSLKAALAMAKHRQTEAARLLGMTYHQFRALYRRMAREPVIDTARQAD